MIEACFKAFARALRIAVAIDPGETGVPVDEGHPEHLSRAARAVWGRTATRSGRMCLVG